MDDDRLSIIEQKNGCEGHAASSGEIFFCRPSQGDIAALITEVRRLRGIEQHARTATDFLYANGWKKIMEDGNLNERMFTLLFLLRDAVQSENQVKISTE